MDEMLVAFWAFSGAVLAANIYIRLSRPEPSVRRPYVLFPPILSAETLNTEPFAAVAGEYSAELMPEAQAAGAD